MNDGLQTTDELMEILFKSAQRSRGGYFDTANAVAQLGNNAGDAFANTKEIVHFSELLNKQFVIAGTEQQGIAAATLQLTQAMGMGVLRGEELNSILEQAPNIVQVIADYMEVPKGEIKELASEGMITADVVKNAMFAATDNINEKFESMPMTFAQVGESIKNNALVAFQPILDRLNEIANSERFQTMVQVIISTISIVASVLVEVFDFIAMGINWVANIFIEYWDIIAPLLMALGTILLAQIITKLWARKPQI